MKSSQFSDARRDGVGASVAVTLEARLEKGRLLALLGAFESVVEAR